VTYYRDPRDWFAVAVEIAFVGGVLLVFAILAARLVLGIVPPGFWPN